MWGMAEEGPQESAAPPGPDPDLGERWLAVFGEEAPLLLTDGEVSHEDERTHVAFSCGKKEPPRSDETDGILQRHERRD